MSVRSVLVSVPELTCLIVCLTPGFSQGQRVRPCNNYYVMSGFQRPLTVLVLGIWKTH